MSKQIEKKYISIPRRLVILGKDDTVRHTPDGVFLTVYSKEGEIMYVYVISPVDAEC